MSTSRQIALLMFDGEMLVPTEVNRTGSLNAQPPQPETFEFGATTRRKRQDREGAAAFTNYYRHFKSDLTLTQKALRGPADPDVWRMKTRFTDDGDGLPQKRSHKGELVRQQGNTKLYFNAVHAAGVFLHHVVGRAVTRARDLFGADVAVAVHFTRPAYDDELRSTSDRYRAALGTVAGGLREHADLADVAFETDGSDFLFEPYGVWQYFASVERAVARRREGEGHQTFLVFDMGGSTTDFALVQVNLRGSNFRLYPMCASAEVAGEYFDRFLLMRLAGLAQLPRVSRRWNAVLEEIEAAKIALCDEREDVVPIDVEGEVHRLTREVLEETTQALWRDQGRGLGPKFRGFVQRALKNARQQGGYAAFDEVERVFVAGGSSKLPGLQRMIREDLAALGLASDGADLFAAPTVCHNGEVIPRSSLAALGQAAEMADDFRLERAGHVFARIEGADGVALTFPRRGSGHPAPALDGETYLFSVGELGDDGAVRLEGEPGLRGPFETVAVGLERDARLGPYRVSFRNDLQDEYPDEPSLTLDPKPLDTDPTDIEAVEFSCHVEAGEGTVRVKPFFRGVVRGGLDRPRLHEPAGKTPVSLRADPVDDHGVHVCIDLGMNNTAVALYAPGRAFPEADDLVVFDLDAPPQRVSEDALASAEGAASGDGVAHAEGVLVSPDLARSAEAPGNPSREGAPSLGSPVAPTAEATPTVSESENGEAPESPAAGDSAAGGPAVHAAPPVPDSDDEEPRSPVTGAPPDPESAERTEAGSVGTPPEPMSTASPDPTPSPRGGATHWAVGLAEWAEGLADRPAAPASAPSGAVDGALERAVDGLARAAQALSAAAASLQSTPDERPAAKTLPDLVNDARLQDGSPFRIGADEDTGYPAFQAFVASHPSGERYPDRVLRQFWTRCASDEGQLVVLAGPPGSGKTTLVRLAAEFFNRGLDATAHPPGWEAFYLLQPVSPAWFSPASLLGAVDPLDGQFRATAFLRFLMHAENHYMDHVPDDAPARRFFACLDEFNIAQPEQYLAELLSRLEAPPESEARRIAFDSGGGTDGASPFWVELYPNLRLFATLNTDASTKTLSPKVLDRCFFLRLTPSLADLEDAADRIAEGHGDAVAPFHATFRPLLVSLDALGRAGNVPLGFRVLRHAYDYAAGHPSLDGEPGPDALAAVAGEVVGSFFVPKLPGAFAVNSEAYEQALGESPLRKVPGVAEVLDRVAGGLPGQFAL